MIRHLFATSLLVLSSLTGQAKPATKLLVEGINKPIAMTAPVGDQKHFFIVGKDGVIHVFDRDKEALLEQTFLDLSGKVTMKMNEQGLLNLAFSPNYAQDRRFYVYYTDTKGDTVVSRFTASPSNPLIALPTTEEILLTQKQDFRNHNGGWLEFGPDGMLYIGLGDGGAANDPKKRAQDMSSYLGKILRIDVSAQKGYKVPKDNPYLSDPSVPDEILCYGLRNPWRCCFHNGNLIIADVGQNKWEEINYVTPSELMKANFGWPQKEASARTKNPKAESTRKDAHEVLPIYEYKHGSGPDEGLSVTGGYVYRGSIEALKGHYFFADYAVPNVWSFTIEGGKPGELHHWKDAFSHNGKAIQHIASFAEDHAGELYLISHLQGKVFQVVDSSH